MTASTRRCLILANPQAGALSRKARRARLWAKADILELLPRRPDYGVSPGLELLTDAAQRAGVIAQVEEAPPFKDYERLARRMRAACEEGIDTIVAVGGDGTVRAFAQTLLQFGLSERLALGILPLGTANNVAHSLMIPFDLDAAMQVLAEGAERRIDAGLVSGEYFLEAAGVGLFADAMQGFGREEPRPWQIGRLLRVLGPLFWNHRARTLQITLDGRRELDEAVMIAVANGPYLGEGVALAPGAALSDGLFDVILVGAISRSELVTFARAVLHGTHLELPFVRRVQAQCVEIRRVHHTHHALPVHADDHIAARTPVVISLVPDALRVLAPKEPTNEVQQYPSTGKYNDFTAD